MDRQRDQIRQTLAGAGGRFHGEQSVVMQRVFYAPGHFQLLGPWFIAVEEPRDYAAGFQHFLSRRQGLGVHVEPSYADAMRPREGWRHLPRLRLLAALMLFASLLVADKKPLPTSQVVLNTATATQLKTLPEIGRASCRERV